MKGTLNTHCKRGHLRTKDNTYLFRQVLKNKKTQLVRICKTCRNERQEVYRAEHRYTVPVEKRREHRRKHYHKNCKTKEFKFQHSARRKVNTEIRAGRLVRQPCEVCNNPKSIAHHEDYNKPLDVRWLCGKHHAEVHKKFNKLVLAEKIIKLTN